jgi:NADPH:quinone reductase-like Zn-dependent oxidoreductase
VKAIVQTGYGSPEVLELKEIDQPAIKNTEVLVRVHACGLNAGDYFSMRGRPWPVRFMAGFPKPRDYVLGWDIAGRVDAAGKDVTACHVGDAVFGACSGALAEYARVTPAHVAPMPTTLTFEQAAAIPTAAITALHGLRDVGRVQPGQRVLINGASGGVGTFAVQIAKALGAEVTGVCSTKNVDLVGSIGADHVIDYTRDDFTRCGQRWDLILDNVANHSFPDLRRVLAPGGAIVPNSGHSGMAYVFNAYLLSLFSRRHRRPFFAATNTKDLVLLTELIKAGNVAPVIDNTYALDQAREAFRYLDQRHARGKVVIAVAQPAGA